MNKQKEIDVEEQSISLFGIAKYISREVTLKHTLESAGANKAKQLEKYEKNAKSVRNLTIFTKIILSIYFAVLAIIPLFLSLQITALFNSGTISSDVALISFGLIFSIYFGLQFVYFLVIGMPVIGVMMEGETFRYLETLPISRKDLRKLAYISIFKNYDAPFIVMFLAFPVLLFAVTLNPFLLLICLGISFLNVLLTFSTLVLAGERMQRFIKKHEEGTKKATFMRVITMLGYVFASFGVVFLIQWILSSLDALVAFFVSLESSSLLNYIFSLIPYPFAPGYLISAFFLEINYTPLLIITMGIGVGLFVLFTRTITLSTLESLKSITSEETLVSIRKSPEEKEREPIPIEVKKTSPLVAFIKKDLSIATKDIQTLMFFIIPILIPVISFISGMASAMNMASADPLTVLIPWSTIFFLGIFNSYLLISGFLNIEQSGSAILASLPIRERNQAKAKLGLIYPVQIIGYLLPALIIMRSPLFLPFLLILLCSLPFILAMTLLVMEIKVLLFGKLRFKYVLDEVKMENKTLKWVILIISGGGLGVMLVIMENMLAFILGFIPVLISLLIIGFLLLGILIYSFNRMFPIIK